MLCGCCVLIFLQICCYVPFNFLPNRPTGPIWSSSYNIHGYLDMSPQASFFLASGRMCRKSDINSQHKGCVPDGHQNSVSFIRTLNRSITCNIGATIHQNTVSLIRTLKRSITCNLLMKKIYWCYYPAASVERFGVSRMLNFLLLCYLLMCSFVRWCCVEWRYVKWYKVVARLNVIIICSIDYLLITIRWREV